ncbi:MAG TPA: hypothetical protein VNQ79_02690 [Blastocatellia bacterium]|nr:hypothetical protein [Blastocatellia bacterium]
MIILDHNITRDQAERLRNWRIRFQRIGVEIGLPSWDDQQEILRWLHYSKQAAFFTRDAEFFRYRLCHHNYCLVVIDAAASETAQIIHRFLRHPAFRTKAGRCGKVFRLSPRQISWWEVGNQKRQTLIW